MSILLLLIPLSVMLLGVAIWAFAWAVRRGQFDDLDTPALDILVETERMDAAPIDEAQATRPTPATRAEGNDDAA